MGCSLDEEWPEDLARDLKTAYYRFRRQYSISFDVKDEAEVGNSFLIYLMLFPFKKKLLSFFKNSIVNGGYDPFDGEIRSDKGSYSKTPTAQVAVSRWSSIKCLRESSSIWTGTTIIFSMVDLPHPLSQKPNYYLFHPKPYRLPLTFSSFCMLYQNDQQDQHYHTGACYYRYQFYVDLRLHHD